jgi:hypothetical protein
VKRNTVSALACLMLMIAACFLATSAAEAKYCGYGCRNQVVKVHKHITKYRDVTKWSVVHRTRWHTAVRYIKPIVHLHTVYRVHHRVRTVWSARCRYVTRHLPATYIRTSSVVNVGGGHGGGYGGY